MDTQTGDQRVTRIIDMKLPLPYILTVIGALATAFATMFFQLGQVREDMSELKIAVKAGNSSTTTVQGQIAILEYRVGTLESDRRARPSGDAHTSSGVTR